MRTVFVAIVLLLSCLSAVGAEVTLVYARPSRVLAMLVLASPDRMLHQWRRSADDPNSMIPVGISSISADDRRRVLVVHGDPDSVDELQRYVSLFDIKVRDLKLTVDIEDPLEQYKARSETTIRNTRVWGMEDGVTNYEIRLAGRINDDNSITLYVTLKHGATRRELKIRVKEGQAIELAPQQILASDPGDLPGLMKEVGKKLIVGQIDADSAKVTIRSRIVDEPPQYPNL